MRASERAPRDVAGESGLPAQGARRAAGGVDRGDRAAVGAEVGGAALVDHRGAVDIGAEVHLEGNLAVCADAVGAVVLGAEDDSVLGGACRRGEDLAGRVEAPGDGAVGVHAVDVRAGRDDEVVAADEEDPGVRFPLELELPADLAGRVDAEEALGVAAGVDRPVGTDRRGRVGAAAERHGPLLVTGGAV